MKNILRLFFLIVLLLPAINIFAQNEESEDDSLSTESDSLNVNDTSAVKDTLAVQDSLRSAFLNSPERLKVIELINTVNENSLKVDLIHSESVVKIKASSIDQTGSIEVKAKKTDDLWFRIWGSFAFVSKDAFIAHFNRKNFIYFDNLNDKVIEGPTNETNIGYILRIKCSFDDMLNVMSGTGRIVYTNTDTLEMKTENNVTIISIKKKGKEVRYWIDAGKSYVEKYSYYNSKKREYLRIVYGNIIPVSGGYFAKKVDIIKPSSNEYIKIVNESYSTNNPALNFKVSFPSDVRRVKWNK